MTYLLDYSAGRLTGQQVSDAGYGGCIRYIDAPERITAKHTTPAEYASLVAAGREVYLVFEVGTTDAEGGFAQGVAYARRALAGAVHLGYTGVIFFCDDRPSTTATQTNIDYIRGAASVLGWPRTGGYGFRAFIQALKAQTPCSNFWQAGARSTLQPYVQIWQDNNWKGTVGGIGVDRNLILSPLPNGNTDVLTQADGNTQWAAKNLYTGETRTAPVADWIGETNAIARKAVDIVAPMYNELDAFVTETRTALAEIKAQLAALTAPGPTAEQLDAAFTRALPVLKVTGEFQAKA